MKGIDRLDHVAYDEAIEHLSQRHQLAGRIEKLAQGRREVTPHCGADPERRETRRREREAQLRKKAKRKQGRR